MNILAFWFSDHIAYDIKLHTHDFHQLIYCKKGGGYITIGNTRHKAVTGYIYLARSGTLHSIESADDMYLLEIKFHSNEGFLSELPEIFNISKLPFAEEMLLRTISEGIGGEEYYGEAANSSFKLFLIHFARHLLKKSRSTEIPTYNYSAVIDIPELSSTNNDLKILNLKHYISDRISGGITLSELANEVNFSVPYFTKRFKILFGMPPIKYLNSMRIARAKQLMLQTELSLSEIAMKCGFESLHYFSRTFKSFEGISPKDFKKSRKFTSG